MAKHKFLSQNYDGPKTILDLPVEIFREIFKYLMDAEIYFNLRCVCWLLRAYAEDYVRIGKTGNHLITMFLYSFNIMEICISRLKIVRF